jgi:hypothetical protein
MKDVKETLDRLVPEPARMSDWDEVLRQARPPRRRRAIQFAVTTGVAALAALFVVAPWKGGEQVGVLDKALAAVGDGPVLHVVFRGGWGGTLVDLKTGERKPLYGEREVWFDPNRGLVHQISRFGGVVEHEEVYPRNEKDHELTALWQDYRGALERGTARVVGEDVVDGVPVYWIIVQSQMLPDVADNKNHELAQQVAISRANFKPVAMKYTRDRQASPDGNEHILRFETVALDEADFTSNPDAALDGKAMMQGSDPMSLERAAGILGRTPYWLGSVYADLPLVQAEKAFSATGNSEKTLVTGARATEIRRCLREEGAARRACRGRFGAVTGALESRGGDLYEVVGPVKWGPQHTGVTLFYGTLGDDPSTFKKDAAPLWTERHVLITETADRELLTRGATMKYVPREGTVVLMPGPAGYLLRDGVFVTILAGSDELILDAARALRPMSSAGSGAGG